MFSMSTKTCKKYVDKVYNGTYNVLKEHESRARWEHMKYKTVYADTVEKKKDDAKELVAILNKIPEEKKGEVIGIVKGYALCAENQRRWWKKMNICEATKKALEENKCIREKPYKVKVKPIKGDVGTIMGLDGSHPVKGWQPTARELISESWEVME